MATVKCGRPGKESEEGEEGPTRRYRIEIGSGPEARVVYERWQALLTRYPEVGQIQLLSSALDIIESAYAKERYFIGYWVLYKKCAVV